MLRENKNYIFIFFLLIFSFGLKCYASEDSTKKIIIKVPTKIHFFAEKDFYSFIPKADTIDQTLRHIEIFNPLHILHHTYIGNPGLASEPMVFDLPMNDQINSGLNTYSLYLMRPDDIKYFATNKRYTEINYDMGSKKEQILTLVHTQNVNKQFNFGFNFNKIGSDGYIKQSVSSITTLDYFNWYQSKNMRYNLFLCAIYNKIKNKESGGVKNDPDNDPLTKDNIDLASLAVNLPGAQDRFNESTLHLTQQYDTGTKGLDSTMIDPLKSIYRISHTFDYKRSYYVYEDSNPTGGFFNQIYKDSLSTLDSLIFQNMSNRISFGIFPGGIKYPGLSLPLLDVSITHDAFRYHQETKDSSFQSLIGGAELNKNVSSHFIASGNVNYYITGVRKGDMNVTASFKYSPDSATEAGVSIGEYVSHPSLLFSYYDGNNFRWDRHLSNLSYQKVSAYFNRAKSGFYGSIHFFTVNKYQYYNSTSEPDQLSNKVKIFRGQIRKDFHIGRIHSDNSIIFQKVMNSDSIHIPSFMPELSVYYQIPPSKKGVQANLGIDFSYVSKYYGDLYNPASGVFYYQDSLKTEGFPLVDLFLCFKIKTARIYVKLENIGDGIFGTGYYMIPHYPMPGRSVKFGISWKFFD